MEVKVQPFTTPKASMEGWEMTQLVKLLPCKCVDETLDPQKPCKVGNIDYMPVVPLLLR